MTLQTNDDWTLNEDRQYATTSDPRVLAVIERDEDGDYRIDGDAYAPAFYIENGRPTPAGSTFMDDASEEIADSYAGARSYFVNSHYAKGGPQMDYDTVTERYLRIFHDTLIYTVQDVVILNTPSWREHIGIDQLDEHTLAVQADDWCAALDGEVYGVGYAVNEDRTDPDEEIDLDDWDVTIECWGYVGETYAQNSAASFENGEPKLAPIDGPRMYQVSYMIDVEALNHEGAAREAARILSKPGAPDRGSYEVTLKNGHKTETVDLGEGEF